MRSRTGYDKIIAVGLIAVLTLAMMSPSSLVFSERGDDDDERYDEERYDDEHANKEYDNEEHFAEKLLMVAEELTEKAHKLLSIAEEHENEAAVEEIEVTFQWIREAEELIEHGELDKAESALHEAWNHLVRAEEHLGTTETNDDERHDEKYDDEKYDDGEHYDEKYDDEKYDDEKYDDGEHHDEKYNDEERFAEKLMMAVEKLTEKAHKLLNIAEEHENEAAVEEIEAAFQWIREAEELIEHGDLKKAKVVLHETWNHLVRVEKQFYTDRSNDHYDEEVWMEAKRMIERVRELHSLAEEHQNERIFEVLNEAISLIKHAVEAAEDGNFEESRNMLAEAHKMLNAAEAMLSATPVPKDHDTADRDHVKEKDKKKLTDIEKDDDRNRDTKVRHTDRKSMAIAKVKIALAAPHSDSGSHSFGSAQLMLKIVANKDPVLRAKINVVTEERPSGALTACLNGDSIGELTTPGSEGKKKITGHLKTTIPNATIQLPGVYVDIVDGPCNGGTKILSGSI